MAKREPEHVLTVDLGKVTSAIDRRRIICLVAAHVYAGKTSGSVEGHHWEIKREG